MTGSLPRLLKGVDPQRASSLEHHERTHGPLVLPGRREREGLIATVEASGLRGRGGAGFPTATKLRVVGQGRRPVVLANCSEGEPASGKDRMLTRHLPHLVLDGVAVAAAAVGAREAIISLSEEDDHARRVMAAALAERRGTDPAFRVVTVPDRYLAGQESALVNFVNTGELKPTMAPPRPFEKGVGGRPTLVQNAETLAHLALIARHGAAWFRELGPAQEPGSTLVTLSGAVRAPGVYEVARGTSLAALVNGAGGPLEPARAYLTSGFFGAWVPADAMGDARLSDHSLRARGSALGAGVVFALGTGGCGVAETVRVVRYLASQSAGQCGPCVFGLPAVAEALTDIATGQATQRTPEDLRRWLDQISGRGACNLPTGAIGFVRSALDVFGSEFGEHYRHGPCAACRRPTGLCLDRSAVAA